MSRRLVTAVLAAALAAIVLPSATAFAQSADAGESAGSGDAAIDRQVRELALAGARSAVRGDDARGGKSLPAPRVEVSIGQLDSRLRLAPCQHVDAYLPEGMRLWGRSRVGLRCTQGAVKWNVYLPVTVKVFGTALVAANGLTGGSLLTSADLVQAEVDLAEDNSAAVARPDLAVGHVLARTLKPGQSLRQSHLKARQWFAAGETVTVLATGDGFSVAGEGQALGNGIEGQPVRVRTEGGRVISGLPVGDRRVELSL